jgi:GNAT superfamily N-acetyltransferase
MFVLKKLNNELCSELNAAAIVSLHGNNQCDLETIHKSCFASELCMYGSTGPDLNVLLYCDYTYVITCDGNFCGCVSADVCKNSIPKFPLINFTPGSLYLHTLCVESKYRKNKLATALINKIKSKGVPIYLSVCTGKNGKRNDLQDFFKSRFTKLINFYTKQGFKKVCSTEDYILFVYE